MKVVLRENVDALGRRGDVVNVAPGYGRNYLIPKKLAFPDAPGYRKVLAAERRAKEAREAREQTEAQTLAVRITGLSLSLTRKSGEEGQLYGSVTAADVAGLLEAAGVEIDKRRILLNEPIRSLGVHAVPIRLHRDVTAQATVEVVAEPAE